MEDFNRFYNMFSVLEVVEKITPDNFKVLKFETEYKGPRDNRVLKNPGLVECEPNAVVKSFMHQVKEMKVWLFDLESSSCPHSDEQGEGHCIVQSWRPAQVPTHRCEC